MICGYYNCPLHLMKPTKLATPDSMSASERAAEITAILAAAIVRSHPSAQNATDQKQRQIRLGFSGQQSVHTNPYQPRNL
jgi:hypothetical protein